MGAVVLVLLYFVGDYFILQRGCRRAVLDPSQGTGSVYKGGVGVLLRVVLNAARALGWVKHGRRI